MNDLCKILFDYSNKCHPHYRATCASAENDRATWTARITQPFSLSLVSFRSL